MTLASPRFLRGAVVFTFLAHGLAMLLMAACLMPMVPGGGTADDAERVARIAASPWLYRLGWAGWQVTAVSDVVLAAALLASPRVPRPAAWAAFVLTVAAVIPDQLGQALLVTRGVDLAREAHAAGDPGLFLRYEGVVFPLTAAWAASLYTVGAAAWCACFAGARAWSPGLTRFSAVLLVVFVFASFTPLLPLARPVPATVIGAANGLGFLLLEIWFVLVWLRLRR